jgi:hypothetical protein
MVIAIANRLIHVDVAIAYLDIEATSRIRANPSLEMNRRSACPEVRERHEIAGLAFLALW